MIIFRGVLKEAVRILVRLTKHSNCHLRKMFNTSVNHFKYLSKYDVKLAAVNKHISYQPFFLSPELSFMRISCTFQGWEVVKEVVVS